MVEFILIPSICIRHMLTLAFLDCTSKHCQTQELFSFYSHTHTQMKLCCLFEVLSLVHSRFGVPG